MSGNDERDYGGYEPPIPRNYNRERNQFIATLLMICIGIGGVAAYMIVYPPLRDGPAIVDDVTPEAEDYYSHVNITGVFASVDVYSFIEVDGTYGYRLHVHTDNNGTYKMDYVIQDNNDFDNNYNYFTRISICIVHENGTYVEHRIRLALDAIYHLVFDDVKFDFFLSL